MDGIIDLSHLQRRFVPRAKGNRDLPADQQLAVYLRGVGKREAAAYLRDLRQMTRDRAGTLARVQAYRGQPVADLDPADVEEDYAGMLVMAEAMERANLAPVVRVVLGDQEVTDPDAIWATLDQDGELKDEVIRECNRAYGLITEDEAPLPE